MLPRPLEKSLFLVSGSDSIEGSIDLARKATSGTDIVGLHVGLHGSTSFISRSRLSFVWNRQQHAVYAARHAGDPWRRIATAARSGSPFRPTIELQCLKTSMTLADANFTGRPAAFIGEPILSAGGVIVPPPGFYAALRKELQARDMLMIMDEAQTGLGKTGKMFGFQHEEGLVPDIIAISKHFGGGLPISAVCTTPEIADRAVANGYFATRSHATDPLLCAAGEESINIVVEEDMAGRATRIESRIRAKAVAEMAERVRTDRRRARPGCAAGHRAGDRSGDPGASQRAGADRRRPLPRAWADLSVARRVRHAECHPAGAAHDNDRRGNRSRDVDPARWASRREPRGFMRGRRIVARSIRRPRFVVA